MSPSSDILTSVIPIAAAFLLVLAIWAACVWAMSLRRSAQGQKVEERLGLGSDHDGATRVLRLWYEGREVTTSVAGSDSGPALIARLQRLVHSAGWDAPLKSIVLGVIGASLLVFLIAFVLSGRVLAGIGATAALLMTLMTYTRHRISRREATFETQLVDALELAARSLRAGHPLVGAFRLISEEIPAPVGVVFAGICQRQDLGVSLQDGVREAADSTGSADMKLFATSVAIQLRSGGNLADMMDRLASVMRERTKLNRRFQVLTAQTQLSKRILIILPIALFALMNVLNPEYMEPLFVTTMGQALMAGAGVSLLLGIWAMNRMVVLRH